MFIIEVPPESIILAYVLFFAAGSFSSLVHLQYLHLLLCKVNIDSGTTTGRIWQIYSLPPPSWSKTTAAGSQLASPPSRNSAAKGDMRQSWLCLGLCVSVSVCLSMRPGRQSWLMLCVLSCPTIHHRCSFCWTLLRKPVQNVALEFCSKINKKEQQVPTGPLAGYVIVFNLLQKAGIAANGNQTTWLCRPNIKITDNVSAWTKWQYKEK